ncbi:MAG TPA: endopeptidase La [Ktedonobacterales bacterium]|nr:endopeptidase La [Ktedonobacterales bacterium]
MENRHRPVRRARRVRTTTSIDAEKEPGYEPSSCAHSAAIARELPVLPVRNTVLLPNMVVPLFIDREPALQAIEAAMAGERAILIVSQRSEQTEDPTYQDVYAVGTECAINRVLRMPDGTSSVLVQGTRRVRIDTWLQHTPYGRVRGTAYSEPDTQNDQLEALARTALGSFETCTKLSQRLTEDSYIQALNIEYPGALADFIVAQLEPPIPVRQDLLETFDPLARLRKACKLLQRELNVLELEHKIHDEVQQEADRGQREYFLREQLKAIQRELGEHDPTLREAVELRTRIQETGMPDDIQARALKELERLEAMPSMAPEYGVLRNYIDWLVSLPWRDETRDSLDLRHVAAVLDANHFGLEKVKDRILEFIAVRKLAPEGRAPILCLAGPPGVGKTSLGRSIAEALGRKFARISLGGVRDEAEIRGHRRTYVGALPGRILQTMKTVGTANPVIVLDEIDKLASDYRGDPAAALLEVLDPEQNNTFSDHFLEVPYDLSHVLFVLTANVLHTIPAPLRDRMEVIEIAGYTEEEKASIACRFLVPKQMRDTGLSSARVEIEDQAIRRIIHEYTFEAGVRGLEREIGAILRRVARRVAEGRRYKAIISATRVPAYLGPQKHFPTEAEERDEVGVATGLAWTAGGGDLTSVEVMAVPGHGSIILTGQLGDVMKESAQAALTYTRARTEELNLPESFHETRDVHVHLPAGSIPKDGPSAGITIAVSMISALTGQPIRRDIAMTGEITLRGRVLPVGGIKEKVLAAYRAGITTIVMPRRNMRDLEEVAETIREHLRFIAVDSMDDVLAEVFQTQRGRTELLPPATGSLTTRSPHPRLPMPEPLPATGRVARSRVRRAVVVATD